MEAASSTTRDPVIARRRRILFAVGGLVLLCVTIVAVTPLLKSDKKAKTVQPPKQAVILARVELRPVGGANGKGLAEVIRRGGQQSVRVLAARIAPSKDGEVYGLFLTNGAKQKLLGSALVGSQRIFVGESKVGIHELEQFKRIELRRATTGANPKETVILRGRIPR